MDQPPGGLLALDPATLTGWACGPVPEQEPPTDLERAAGAPWDKPRSGVKEIGFPGCDYGLFIECYDIWIGDRLAALRPGTVAYEIPVIGGFGKAGQVNIKTVSKLFGAVAIITRAAQRHGCDLLPVHNATIKKHFGRGAGRKKEAIQRRCRELGWRYRDDNEADALALFDFASSCLQRRVRVA